MARQDERVARAIHELAAESPIRLQVIGGSMEPLLVDGASVVIEARRFYWPGDVIAIRSPDDHLRVHRLIGYRPGPRTGNKSGGRRWQVVTQGDATASLDVPVAMDRVLGRVIGGDLPRELVRIPLGRRLRAFRRFAYLASRSLLRRRSRDR